MIFAILVVLLILTVLGAPNVGLVSYGWYPSGGLGLVLVVVLILLLMGRL